MKIRKRIRPTAFQKRWKEKQECSHSIGVGKDLDDNIIFVSQCDQPEDYKLEHPFKYCPDCGKKLRK